MIVENDEILKQVRRDLKDMGYKIKTHNNSLGRFFEVFDNNNVKVFQLANKDHWEKHKEVITYLKKYESNKGVIVLR